MTDAASVGHEPPAPPRAAAWATGTVTALGAVLLAVVAFAVFVVPNALSNPAAIISLGVHSAAGGVLLALRRRIRNRLWMFATLPVCVFYVFGPLVTVLVLAVGEGDPQPLFLVMLILVAALAATAAACQVWLAVSKPAQAPVTRE